MKRYFENLAKVLLGQSYKTLNPSEQKIIGSIAQQTPLSENLNERFREHQTLGQRAADKMAAFGGSWPFIGLFAVIIIGWIGVNSWVLFDKEPFDPYPYILLNLALSTLAALQAPIIMMSQNRQAAKDRLKQDATYEINLKLELELKRLHDKIDALQSSNPSPASE